MEMNKETKFEPKKFENKKINRYTYKGMSKFTYRLIWTALWLLFIFGLIAIFGTMKPLWLLIVWLLGW